MNPARRVAGSTDRAACARLPRLGAIAAAIAILLAAPGAFGQSAPASGTALEQARAKYQHGVEAYKAGRHQEAIDRFLEADKLASSPAFAFNVAVAYEDMADRARAVHWFRVYLRRLPAAPDRAEVEQRITRVETELRGRGVQQVSIESAPEGAEVAVDGRTVGVTPWAGALAPGRHVAIARMSGHADARQEFVLAADRSLSVTFPLVATTTAPGRRAAPPPPGAERAAAADAPGVRPLTWIALGVGAVALGGAVGFEVARAAAEDDARAAETQIDAAEAADMMADRRTVARVLLGVGAGATVAGGVLLIVDLTRDAPAKAARRAGRLHAGIGCIGGSCGAALDGRF